MLFTHVFRLLMSAGVFFTTTYTTLYNVQFKSPEKHAGHVQSVRDVVRVRWRTSCELGVSGSFHSSSSAKSFQQIWQLVVRCIVGDSWVWILSRILVQEHSQWSRHVAVSLGSFPRCDRCWPRSCWFFWIDFGACSNWNQKKRRIYSFRLFTNSRYTCNLRERSQSRFGGRPQWGGGRVNHTMTFRDLWSRK